MKAASAGLITHLTTGQAFRRAELWTFTLASGQAARYTNLDVDVKVGADTWSANGPVFKRPRSRQVTGVEVDDFTINVMARATDLIAGVTWPRAARLGAFRHGRLLIERVYMPTWGDVTLGKLYCMGGRLADIAGSPRDIEITVKSDLELFNTMLPRHLYQPGCLHTLFDAGCTLVKASFAVNGTVSGGSTVSTINCGLAQADDHFSLGQIQFTSGANTAVTRAVKRYTVGVFKLAVPLLLAPTPGDTFTAFPGCDKKQATCTTKFNNLVNFQGFPYIPRPESAI